MINNNFRKFINEYKALNWNSLLRKDLGEYNIEESKPNWERIKIILDRILFDPELDNLSVTFQNTIQNELSGFLNFTREVVRNFQNTKEREHWMERIKQKEFDIQKNLGIFYNFLASIDPSGKGQLSEYTKEIEESIKRLKEKTEVIDSLLTGAQLKATQAESTGFGRDFGDESDKNKIRAYWARGGIAFGVLGTATLAFLSLQDPFVIAEEGAWLDKLLNLIYEQNLLIKVIILSLGGYVIAHFSKVYDAEKHLENVNKQRHNALQSHKQILNSVASTASENDKEISNAILLELTRAIFESKETGYLKSAGNPASPANQIVEISKTMTK